MTRRVVITGAASGIGAATAARLRGGGARVVGLDRRSDGDGILHCDVRDQASVSSAVAQAVARLGGLDALVNCAGVGLPQRATEPPGEDAREVIEVNLLGPWRVTAAALPALRESRGRIVNVASGLAYLTFPFAPAYCMSKRGLVAFSDALRMEIGHEVTVTTVYPGYVRTPIHRPSEEHGVALDGLVPEEGLEAVSRRVARAVLGRPVRDLATSRMGAASYAALRLLPPGLVDRAVIAMVRRRARRGGMDASPLAEELATALRDR